MAEIIYVSGLKELHVRLQALADTVGGKKAAQPVVHGLRKAGNILKASAMGKVRKKSRTLEQNIITARPKRRQPGMETVIVTIRSKAKRYKDTARNRKAGKVGGDYKDYGPLFYGRLLEMGFHDRAGVFHIYPYFRPAFEENKARLPEVVAADIREGLDKVAPQ